MKLKDNEDTEIIEEPEEPKNEEIKEENINDTVVSEKTETVDVQKNSNQIIQGLEDEKNVEPNQE